MTLYSLDLQLYMLFLPEFHCSLSATSPLTFLNHNAAKSQEYHLLSRKMARQQIWSMKGSLAVLECARVCRLLMTQLMTPTIVALETRAFNALQGSP
jgi:hypothetical protein